MLIFGWETVTSVYGINEYQERRIIIYVNSIFNLNTYFSSFLVVFPCTFIVVILTTF